MRRALIVAGGLALALSLSACSGVGDGKYQDADSLVRAATASTAKAKSSTFTMDMKVGPLVATGQGEASYAGADTAMQMTMSLDLGALGAQAGMSKLDMEARLVDQTMYMKLPGDMPGVSVDPEQPWFKVAIDDMVPGGGGGLDMSKYLDQADPTKVIELLEESGELVETDPDVSVNGQPATMYRFEVDGQKLLERYGGSLDGIPGLSGIDLGEIPMDVFLNADDLPVQFQVDMSELIQEVVDAAGGEDALPPGVNFDDAYVSMKFTNWGSAVNVEAPPSDEVTDAPLPGMGG